MNIIVVGASGAMGIELVRAIEMSNQHTIFAAFQSTPDESQKFPVFTNFAKLTDYIATSTQRPEMIIDFSTPHITASLLQFATEQSLPIVLATTGHDKTHEVLIQEAAQKIAIFDTNNTSIGVAILLETIQNLTRTLYPLGYDIEIIEKHHRYKKDAPSGTALMIQQAIQLAINEQIKIIFGRSGQYQSREHHEIAIHAIRGGDIVGEHQIIFANNHEVIELTHQASNKRLFAQGALVCGEYLLQQPAGIYTMKNLL